ncbi:MAG: alpha/beta hydrolase domain-containing protein, partial [Deltaproteobacteria bacterium]
PLATYTGWNLRSEQAGAAGALARLAGSYLPFAGTATEREKTGDPRLSVAERHPTREHYLARVAEAAVRLRDERFLLDEDVVEIVKTAGGRALDPRAK